MYLRGTFNSWLGTQMTLVSNYTWQINLVLSNGAAFKFDAYSNWSVNFGDNNVDGYADQNGANITNTNITGTYQIQFNDSTKAYSMVLTSTNYLYLWPAVGDYTIPTILNGNPIKIYSNGTLVKSGSMGLYWYYSSYYSYAVMTNLALGTYTFVYDVTNVNSDGTSTRYYLSTNCAYTTNGQNLYFTPSSSTWTNTYTSTYTNMYLRGTFNNWAGSKMTLVSNYTWQITQVLTNGAAFKFDVYSNWSVNFGDDNRDYVANQNGANITNTNVTGTYKIRFNDSTKVYSYTLQ